MSNLEIALITFSAMVVIREFARWHLGRQRRSNNKAIAIQQAHKKIDELHQKGIHAEIGEAEEIAKDVWRVSIKLKSNIMPQAEVNLDNLLRREQEVRHLALDCLGPDVFAEWADKDHDSLFEIFDTCNKMGYEASVQSTSYPYNLMIFTKDPFDVIISGTPEHIINEFKNEEI